MSDISDNVILKQKFSILKKFDIKDIENFNNIHNHILDYYTDTIDDGILSFFEQLHLKMKYEDDIIPKYILSSIKLNYNSNNFENYINALFIKFLYLYQYERQLLEMGLDYKDSNLLNIFEKNYKVLSELYPNELITEDDISKLCNDKITEKDLKQVLHSPINSERFYNKDNTIDKYILCKKNILYNDESLYNLINSISLSSYINIASIYGRVIDNFTGEYNICIVFQELNMDTVNKFENYVEKLFCSLLFKEYIPASFKEKYPEYFVDNKDLQEYLNDNRLTAEYLSNHPEYKEYLIGKNLQKLINKCAYNFCTDTYFNLFYYLKKYQIEDSETLDLLIEYGKIFDKSIINLKYHEKITKENILNDIKRSFRENFIDGTLSYQDLNSSFKEDNPDLIINEFAPEKYKELFYDHNIKASTLRDFPDIVNFLRDKDVHFYTNKNNNGLRLIYDKFVKKNIYGDNVIDIESMYNLAIKYGGILDNNDISFYLEYVSFPNYEGLDKYIYDYINTEDYLTFNNYYKYKDLYIDNRPELFLDENAPFDLKATFYSSNFKLSYLKKHKEWIKYLKDKEFKYSMSKLNKDFIDQLNKNLSNSEILDIMEKYPDELLKAIDYNSYAEEIGIWYKKHHFLPRYEVFSNFPIEETDNFMLAAKKWSKIMNYIEDNGFCNSEYLEAVVKLSYVFGVFHNDDRGFNIVFDTLFSLPKKILACDYQWILHFSNSKVKLENMYDVTKEGDWVLKKRANVMNKDYQRMRLDILNSYSTILDNNIELIHQLFGGLTMKYDPDFREFFLKYKDDFFSNKDYISKIQEQFEEIKIFNSNRKLTFVEAYDFVKSHVYKSSRPEDYLLQELASKVGYSEPKFNMLQNIFDESKKRIYSSIPRIFGEYNEYYYEITKLDDPISLVVGNLTSCCQSLGNAAEDSMIHSATDPNGRLFIVKDNLGEIVAQSWVWRKKYLLCFDNIEIPDKAFENKNHEKFSKEILEIYKIASQQIMEVENIKFQNEELKKIYDVKLSNITVGLGYNDIKSCIEKNLEEDFGYINLPTFQNGAAVYTDADTQYFLLRDVNNYKKVNDIKVEELNLYHDSYELKDNLSLEELKLLCTFKSIINNQISNEDIDIYSNNYIREISYNYNIYKSNIRIVMNYNMALICELNDNEILIHDILHNGTESALKQSEIVIEDLKKNYEVTLKGELFKEKSKKLIITNKNIITK